MRAMAITAIGQPLEMVDLPDPRPGPGEVCIRVAACGVCRTDLHIIDGELPEPDLPRILGHEIVGTVKAVGEGVSPQRIGEQVGVGWLGRTCGKCSFCRLGQENLCDEPVFTGYSRDGGFATEVLADARFTYRLDLQGDPASLAPLLCAGLIGWRSLMMAGDGEAIGIYGFGAAGHIISQIARSQDRKVHVFTRPGDVDSQDFALSLGAVWAGGSDEEAPLPLDAALIYAPVGALVIAALRAVRKGGRVVCAGIHMSDIPSFPYRWLWEERQIRSVANLTRSDAEQFLSRIARMNVVTHVTPYPLASANQALDDIRHGRVKGAAVLVP